MSHFRSLFGKKEVRLLICGSDKTTILYKLKHDEIVTTIPNIGEEVLWLNGACVCVGGGEGVQ